MPFEVVAPDVEELETGDPEELVVENAVRKARSVAPATPADATVLGVDTTVALEGEVYGKPIDEEAARACLRLLSGRTHLVWSGLAVMEDGSERHARAVTKVRFRDLADEEIDWYVSTGDWAERAGGYAIQGVGAALVERIEGDFWNVVGLPVPELLRLLPGLLRGRPGA